MSCVTKFLPMFDRILVKRVATEAKSLGGVILPDSATPKANIGTVISVGQGIRKPDGGFVPLSVKAGDVVCLPEYGGSIIELKNESGSNEDYFLFRESEIVGVISK